MLVNMKEFKTRYEALSWCRVYALGAIGVFVQEADGCYDEPHIYRPSEPMVLARITGFGKPISWNTVEARS